jgi:hypothetical protein
MWLLYCIKTTATIKAPPGGALAPMLVTLEQSGGAFLSYLQSDRGVESTRAAFFDAMNNCRMRRGTGKWRKELVAIGEKNPPEYTAPAMQDFILEAFPESKFIHVVRHPVAVVHSQMGFLYKRIASNSLEVSPLWKEHQESIHFLNWAGIEQHVLKIRAPVLTIGYEDFVDDPVHESHRLYEFFGVSSNDYIDRRIRHNVVASGNTQYGHLSVPENVEGLAELMDWYGYKNCPGG